MNSGRSWSSTICTTRVGRSWEWPSPGWPDLEACGGVRARRREPARRPAGRSWPRRRWSTGSDCSSRAPKDWRHSPRPAFLIIEVGRTFRATLNGGAATVAPRLTASATAPGERAGRVRTTSGLGSEDACLPPAALGRSRRPDRAGARPRDPGARPAGGRGRARARPSPARCSGCSAAPGCSACPTPRSTAAAGCRTRSTSRSSRRSGRSGRASGSGSRCTR